MTPEEQLACPGDERDLLCGLLAPSCRPYIGDVLDTLDPDDFYDVPTGRVWAAAQALHGQQRPITYRALRTATTDAHPDVVARRLDAVAGWPGNAAGLTRYAHRVREAAQLRRLIQAATRITQRTLTAENYSTALAAAHDELAALDQRAEADGDSPRAFAELADEFDKSMVGGGPVVGEVVPTPWGEVNDLLSGGLHPGRSVLIAGRPGEGKSLIGLNLATHAAEQGLTALVVSQEMGAAELTGRVMSAGGRVPYREITRMSLSPGSSMAVAEYAATNRDMPLFVVDRPNLTIERVAAIARTFQRRRGLDLLVIDYLQLLTPTFREEIREQQVAHISRSIKHLSRELSCAVVSMAQLNRKPTDGAPRRPTVNDLRESGSQEQDADTVVLLFHERGQEGRPTGYITVIVGKNRSGPCGEVELRWRADEARVGD